LGTLFKRSPDDGSIIRHAANGNTAEQFKFMVTDNCASMDLREHPAKRAKLLLGAEGFFGLYILNLGRTIIGICSVDRASAESEEVS
jgi:hypothetical protein